MIEIPQMVKVHQAFCREKIENAERATYETLAASGVALKPNSRVAVAVGSRGIANLPLIVKAVTGWIRSQGASPFVVPAMGSHGNGVAEAQTEILAGLGVTERSVGAPIISSMEVVELPADGLTNHVYMDKNAFAADATIVINRIKIHGDFFGPTESGLLKMCVIGLGKHKQALEIHGYDITELRARIVATAKQVIKHGNIVLGVGIVENAYHETMRIEAIAPAHFEAEEMRLLALYKRIMPMLPVEALDILIVDEIGKEISGAGMETKIVGRLRSGAEEPAKPKIGYIVTTDITEASHGNACGVGLADFITRKLFDKIDLAATNENIVTCRCIEQGRIPIIARDDREAIEFAIRAMGKKGAAQLRMARIKNTLRMDQVFLTPNLLPEINAAAHVDGSLRDMLRPGERTLTPFDEIE